MLSQGKFCVFAILVNKSIPPLDKVEIEKLLLSKLRPSTVSFQGANLCHALLRWFILSSVKPCMFNSFNIFIKDSL